VANIGKFASGLKSGVSKLNAFRVSVGRVAKSLLNFGTAMTGLAAGGGIAFMIKRQLDFLDTLGKTSQKLGIQTAELQKLRHAAAKTGVEIKSFDTGFQRMVKRIGQASQGRGEAAKVLKEMQLDPKQLAAMRPEQAFKAIAGRVNELGTSYDKVRVAAALFDSEGVGLVNTLALGKEGLEKMGEEAERLGVAFTEDSVRGAEAAKDAIHNLGQAIQGVMAQIAVDMAPFVSMFAEHLAGGIAKAGEEVSWFGEAIEKIGDIVWVATSLFKQLKVAVLWALEQIVTGFAKLIELQHKLLWRHVPVAGDVSQDLRNLTRDYASAMKQLREEATQDVIDFGKTRMPSEAAAAMRMKWRLRKSLERYDDGRAPAGGAALTPVPALLAGSAGAASAIASAASTSQMVMHDQLKVQEQIEENTRDPGEAMEVEEE